MKPNTKRVKRPADLTWHHTPGCKPRPASTYRGARRNAASNGAEKLPLYGLPYIPPKGRLPFARELRARRLVELVRLINQREQTAARKVAQ